MLVPFGLVYYYYVRVNRKGISKAAKLSATHTQVIAMLTKWVIDRVPVRFSDLVGCCLYIWLNSVQSQVWPDQLWRACYGLEVNILIPPKLNINAIMRCPICLATTCCIVYLQQFILSFLLLHCSGSLGSKLSGKTKSKTFIL